MIKPEISFEEALRYLVKKEVTAYEIHKFSGLSQAGLRKLFKGTIDKPQRKTKEVIIDYYNVITNASVEKVVSNNKKPKLKPEEVVSFKNTLIDHEEQLLENNDIRQWLELKLSQRESAIHLEYKKRPNN